MNPRNFIYRTKAQTDRAKRLIATPAPTLPQPLARIAAIHARKQGMSLSDLVTNMLVDLGRKKGGVR